MYCIRFLLLVLLIQGINGTIMTFDDHTFILTPTSINKNKKGEIFNTKVLKDRKLKNSQEFKIWIE